VGTNTHALNNQKTAKTASAISFLNGLKRQTHQSFMILISWLESMAGFKLNHYGLQ